jgi:hypothetical protein
VIETGGSGLLGVVTAFVNRVFDLGRAAVDPPHLASDSA